MKPGQSNCLLDPGKVMVLNRDFEGWDYEVEDSSSCDELLMLTSANVVRGVTERVLDDEGVCDNSFLALIFFFFATRTHTRD